MNSSLYQCRIFHKRLRPVERKFSYSVFMLSLDLDELDTLSDSHWLFSRNSWNIYSIYDDDYLDYNDIPSIKRKLIKYLKDQQFDTNQIAKIYLHTFPRILGYQFNPVSFYYLEDASGKTLANIAEVGNTYHEKNTLYFSCHNSFNNKLC